MTDRPPSGSPYLGPTPFELDVADQFRQQLGEANLQRTALDVFLNVPRAFGTIPVCLTCGKEEDECTCH